jgi:HPt (histidine-containing phosphotransfer) domain-containing protein
MVESIKDKAIANISEFINSCPKFVDSQTLDLQTFQDLRAAIGDDEMFSDLVKIYLSSAEDYKESLQVAIAKQDANEFSITAHSFKSISASIGAMRVSRICSYLEKIGKTGEITISFNKSKGVLDLLNDEHQLAIAAIKALILEFVAE